MHIVDYRNYKAPLRLVQTTADFSHTAQNTRKQPFPADRLCFSEGDSMHRLPFEQVIYCKSDSNYCHIFAKGHKYLISKTLKWVFQQLPPTLFIRVHHQYVVKIDDILTLDKKAWNIGIRSGEWLPVSRSHRAEVVQLFK